MRVSEVLVFLYIYIYIYLFILITIGPTSVDQRDRLDRKYQVSLILLCGFELLKNLLKDCPDAIIFYI